LTPMNLLLYPYV